MSAILLALLPFVFVGAVLLMSRALVKPRAPAARAEEPTCGKCGYIVRGIAGWTCPECGSDLREVGIVAPGLRKALGTPARLGIWALVATAPALILGAVGASYLAPWDVTSTRNRAIFIQSPAVNAVIHVGQEGRQRVMGRPAHNHPLPPQTMTLSLRNVQTSDDMTVDLASGAARFADATGKVVTGTLDTAFVAAWLNANGVNGPTQHAADVLAAVDDMKSNGGGGFRNFSPNAARGNQPDVVAHPASSPFVVPSPTAITPFLPFVLAAMLWLSGLPLVLRRRGSTRRVVWGRVESPRDANQA